MTAFYNEIDPFAAQWLRNLIDAGHIAPGVVDERSIWDIAPEELDGFTQCHFFAGIGVWSHALRSAGWPDDRPVWTASCPCQPFSTAGKRAGTSDERHAWPAVLWLAQARRPRTIFGEQVSSKDGLGWFDIVQSDMDREGYTVSGLDTCAAGVGAPHRRQRLYFVADAAGGGREEHPPTGLRQQQPRRNDAGGCSEGRELADADSARSQGHGAGSGPRAPAEEVSAGGTCGPGVVGDSSGQHLRGERGERARAAQEGEGTSRERERLRADDCVAGGAHDPKIGIQSIWDRPDWALCDDPGGARWRPIEPGTFPLADGTPSRVGRLRAYGNALCAPQAEAFVRARMDLEVTA
ncbi:DNA cytosine methyltransferase [bacterium]|nr:DNA cytosine methyltransferase [bacterium]